jgi:hypothetical protein
LQPNMTWIVTIHDIPNIDRADNKIVIRLIVAIRGVIAGPCIWLLVIGLCTAKYRPYLAATS